ncbi:hypothetical protein QCA50_016427 [Cerrena zonata]|uniref:Uncharacterized protein n=1 Tax=Cerrena zonata TaxID=2478898 RepID=A0AAW0FFT2_9APHY
MAAIDIFKRAGNEALEVNPPNPSIDIHLTNHGSDWLWAAFSVFALFAIAHAVIYGFVSSKSSALKKSLSYRALSANKLANLLIVFQIIVWILYPIAWGLSEGGNKIQPDSEAVFYGILDLITFAFVPTILTWLNVKDVDEGFFHNWFRSGSLSEKHIGGSPRVSGDTAFSPAPAATDEPVAEPEATASTNQQTESV